MSAEANPDCGFAAALEVIGGKWKTDVIWELHLAPRRFAELRRLLPGISEKVLAQQLRKMEADGLLTRHVSDDVPPHVEYTITPLGMSLNEAVTSMSNWGKRHEAWRTQAEPRQ